MDFLLSISPQHQSRGSKDFRPSVEFLGSRH